MRYATLEEQRQAQAQAKAGAELFAEFCEMLDGCYPVEIGRCTYRASIVLASVDPIAFHCAAVDYLDAVMRNRNDVSLEAAEEYVRLDSMYCRDYGSYNTGTGAFE